MVPAFFLTKKSQLVVRIYQGGNSTFNYDQLLLITFKKCCRFFQKPSVPLQMEFSEEQKKVSTKGGRSTKGVATKGK